MTGRKKGDRWEKKWGLQVQPDMKSAHKALPKTSPPLHNVKSATKPQSWDQHWAVSPGSRTLLKAVFSPHSTGEKQNSGNTPASETSRTQPLTCYTFKMTISIISHSVLFMIPMYNPTSSSLLRWKNEIKLYEQHFFKLNPREQICGVDFFPLTETARGGCQCCSMMEQLPLGLEGKSHAGAQLQKKEPSSSVTVNWPLQSSADWPWQRQKMGLRQCCGTIPVKQGSSLPGSSKEREKNSNASPISLSNTPLPSTHTQWMGVHPSLCLQTILMIKIAMIKTIYTRGCWKRIPNQVRCEC